MALFSIENIYIYVIYTIPISTHRHTIHPHLCIYVCTCTCVYILVCIIEYHIFSLFYVADFHIFVYSSLKEVYPILIFAHRVDTFSLLAFASHLLLWECPSLTQCRCCLMSPSTRYFLVFQSWMWGIFVGVSVVLSY